MNYLMNCLSKILIFYDLVDLAKNLSVCIQGRGIIVREPNNDPRIACEILVRGYHGQIYSLAVSGRTQKLLGKYELKVAKVCCGVKRFALNHRYAGLVCNRIISRISYKP